MKVNGDWIASSILAGAKNFGTGGVEGGGDDNINFGDANDHKITAVTDPAIVAKIASITVEGLVFGTPVSFRAFQQKL